MNCDVGEATEWLENELCTFSKLFRRFTYATTHSQTLPSLYLRHSSFSNPSVALSTSQLNLQRSLIFQSLHRFTYVTAHSPNPSAALPTSQLILQRSLISQPLHRFTYVTVHSLTLPLLHLCHSSFSNPSFASPTLRDLHLIYVITHSPTLPSL